MRFSKLAVMALSAAVILSLSACVPSEKINTAPPEAEETALPEEAEEAAQAESAEEKASSLPTALNESKENSIRDYFVNTYNTGDGSVPLCVGSTEKICDIPVKYIDDNTEIPYVSMDTAVRIMTLARITEAGVKITGKQSGKSYFITRENGAYCRIDFTHNTLRFKERDLFFSNFGANEGISALLESDCSVMQREITMVRGGGDVIFNLDTYCITPLEIDGEYFLPAQTVSDIFLSPRSTNLLYNGKIFIIRKTDALKNENGLTELGKLYYGVPEKKKSNVLCQFNYNELCFVLDNAYGLKATYEITSFDKLFTEIGLAELLLDGDSASTSAAADILMNSAYSDGISRLLLDSPTAKAETKKTEEKKISAESGYAEYEDTAYIRIGEFTCNRYLDYYSVVPGQVDEDTITLLIYAHGLLSRPDCHIKRVVLDISESSGGLNDSAIAAIAMFLGSAQISTSSIKTNARTESTYRFDANRDGVYDEKDSLSGFELYCVTGADNGCAGLIAAAFKASNKVTLIGRTVYGCMNRTATVSTADGCLFEIPGLTRNDIRKNGIFHKAENGIEPDIYMQNMSTAENMEEMNYFLDIMV